MISVTFKRESMPLIFFSNIGYKKEILNLRFQFERTNLMFAMAFEKI